MKSFVSLGFFTKFLLATDISAHFFQFFNAYTCVRTIFFSQKLLVISGYFDLNSENSDVWNRSETLV